MERSILIAKNPWWKGKEHFKEDEDYKRWEEKKIKWLPKMLNEIELKPFALHFVFGPRQAGKTTLIKLKIKQLLDGETEPESLFYFRCDELKDYKELDELLAAYFEFKEESNINSSYIFLDEITFAEEWFRSIKSKIDDGVFKKDVVVITGSVSLEVMKHTEYFPGRRGNGKDFFVYPLCFREFVKVMKPEIYKKLPELSSFEFEEIKPKATKVYLYINELNSLLNVYLRIGGFPLAINSYSEHNKISSAVKAVYLGWIKNDIVKVNKSVSTAREILKILATKIPSAISWEGIAKETSIKSPKTVNSYLHLFEEMFLAIISYYLDLNSLTIEFGKNKKVHFADPLLYEIFEEWCLVEIKDKEHKKAEDLIASHLLRFGKSSGAFSEQVFYWQNSTEIDSLIRTKHKAIGFEVKWADKVKPLSIVVGKMKETYLISKNTFDMSKRIIPMSVFISLLNA